MLRNLGALLAEAIRHEPRFGRFKSLATEITKDFFAQHYPGGDWTDLGENYELLRQQTGEMVALIKELLPQHFGS